MPPLTLPNVSSRYGAPMGRRESLPADPAAPIKLRLVHVPFVDLCYDRGGAYWGMPANLYHAQSVEAVAMSPDWMGENEPHAAVLFVRASSHRDAKEKIRARVPGARFFR